MGATYAIWLLTDDGVDLAQLDRIHSLEYSMAVNDIGACKLVLPGDYDYALFGPDNIVEVWRQPDGGALHLERAYLIRRRVRKTDANGLPSIEVTGYDGNELLKRRIVAYYSGSAQASQTDQADDMCKVIVRQNMGASVTDTARDWDSTLFTVAADLAAGPSISKSFAWRNVLNVLQDIAEASRTAGTRLYWDVVPLGSAKFEFRTFTGQRGIDHSYPDGQGVVLVGMEYGNLADAELDEDWSEEATYVYGEGQGEGANRTQQTAEDTIRSGRSVWGRREVLADARDQSASAGVLARARQRLDEGRPTIRFKGRIVDTEQSKYGLHWHWGDKLTGIYEGQKYDAMVRTVRVSVDENGRETVDARLEADE